jgi:cyclohexyl-isocyanide hydratase
MSSQVSSRRELLRRLSLASAGAALSPSAGAAERLASREAPPPLHTRPQQELRMGSEQIAILVYPEFTALDALGPHYALAGMMGATVRFVAKTLDPVPCEGASRGGFWVKPHLTFADLPERLDLLLVPGGLAGTFAAIEDPSVLRFIADRARTTRLVGSICTGSLILGAAGLLRGRRATSHWQTLAVLEDCGATPVEERIVFDGEDRVTAAGVSAGIDLGLELVRRYRGDFYAKGIQLLGEYDPQPPFPGGGNPRTADRVAVDMLNTMHAPLINRFREALVKAQKR